MRERFSPEGFYLALDSSGMVGYVAVSRGAEVLARLTLEHRGQHASRLLPAVDEVLDEAGVDREELSGIVVGEGPGSFTGVRVAAATAKGLARGLDLPLWALSSLAAGAVADLGSASPGVRFVLFDARAERVYGACYGVGVAGVETLVPPFAGELRELLAGDVPVGAAFTGGAAERHRRAIEGAGYAVLLPPLGEPTGDALIHFLSTHPDTSPVGSFETWEPRYLKASSAERAWDSVAPA